MGSQHPTASSSSTALDNRAEPFSTKKETVSGKKSNPSLSGGKDSTAMLIKMIEMEMVIDDIVFINVMATPTMGAEFPEMYDYLDKLEDYIGRKITRVPSVISFDEGFHQTYKKGARKGVIYGYPFTIGAWCNDRLKLRAIEKHYKTYGEHIRYLGIAADETKRLKHLTPNCRAPLADWRMTEQDCINFLKERDMMNPLYKKFKRLRMYVSIFRVVSNSGSLLLYDW